VVAQLLLKHEQLGLGVHLERQSAVGVPLVAAAATILPPQRAEGIKVRADHEPPRTKLLLLLLFAFTLPSLKLTFHAFAGLLAYDDDAQ
jgi:hypothetical protein